MRHVDSYASALGATTDDLDPLFEAAGIDYLLAMDDHEWLERSRTAAG